MAAALGRRAKHTLLRTAVAGVALLILGWLAVASPVALASGTASVTPGGGTLMTTYTLAVQGMAPNDGVVIVLYDGAGNRFTYQLYGVDQAIVVDDNGNASMSVTPGLDLPGSAPGTWTATFTVQETGESATLRFDVAGQQ